MKTIRIKNENYLLVSVKDVCNFIQNESKLTDKAIGKIEWNFKKKVVYNLYKEYQKGSIFNSLLIPEHDDYFLSWTRFWQLEKDLRSKGIYCTELFSLLSDPTEIELNPLFEEV